MPITPCFDPATGASGGASGGGGGAAALPDWRPIDVTDGSWTAADPGSLGRVSSVAVVGTQTTVTWAAASTGSTDSLDGSTFAGQRYYQALTYADGTAVSATDPGWTIETWVDIPAVPGCARTQFALGVSSSPTSTANATANLGGLYWSPDFVNGSSRIGMIRGSTSPLSAHNNANQYGYARSAFIPNKAGLAFGWAIQTSGASTGFNNRSMGNYTGQPYLQLNMGAPNGRTISAGEQNAFSVFFRILRTPIGPAGNRP